MVFHKAAACSGERAPLFARQPQTLARVDDQRRPDEGEADGARALEPLVKYEYAARELQ